MPDGTAQFSEVPGAARVAVGTALQRAVGVAVLLVGLGVVVAPRMSVNRYPVAVAALGLVAVTVGWALPLGPYRGLGRVSRRSWDMAAAVLCVLLGAVGGVVAYEGAYESTWDPGVVEAASARPYGANVVAHFSVYPNMLPFLGAARVVRSWTAGTGMDYAGAFAAVNTVSLLATAVALYLTVRWVAGPARGVLALLLLGALLGTTPWLSVAYTDMAVLWAPIGAVALLGAAQRRGGLARSALLAGAGGAVLAVGYAVKVTPVVGLVAFLLTLAVTAMGRHGPAARRLLALGCCAVAAFLITVPAVGVWARAADGLPPLHRQWAATPLTYVAEGLRTERSMQGGPVLYGAFDRDVVEQTKRRDAAAQNATAWRFIRQQWAARGLLGTAGFAVDKTLFNWGDGTFWARGEGLDRTAPALRHGLSADAVLTWDAPAGSLFGLHVLLEQVVWTAVLLALGVGLVRSRFRAELLLMALTITGIATFTLLFQGRSRYLLVHVPVLIALASSVVPRPGTWRPSPLRRGRREVDAPAQGAIQFTRARSGAGSAPSLPR